MNKIKILGLIVLILFGIFLFVYGAHDDSPGGQLLGLVLAIGSVVGLVRIYRRSD